MLSSTQLDQRDIRDRLYQNLPPEWFPDLENAPNLAGVLDMLAAVWTSQQVIERTLQFDTASTTLVINPLADSPFKLPIGSLLRGDGVVGNPVVTRSTTETLFGTVYQTIIVNTVQILPIGTKLIFSLPDTESDGLLEALDYTIAQTRLQTSTDQWLDLFGRDFFGPRLQRHVSELDVSYRKRLFDNVLAPRLTRCAVTCGVTNLTGFKPTIIEVRNPGDCGSYGQLGSRSWGGMAYGKAGAYGSLELPFQFFIKCTRPFGAGIPVVNGYGMSNSGYATYQMPFGYIGANFPPDTGTGEWCKLSDIDNNIAVTDDDIYNTVADTVAAGVTAWTNISSDIESEIRSSGMLDISFYLDLTTLALDIANPGQIIVSGVLPIVAEAEIVYNTFNMASILRVQAQAAFNNPSAIAVAAIPISIKPLVAIDTHFVESAAIFKIVSAAALSSSDAVTAIGTLPKISSVATFTATALTNITGNLPLVARIVMDTVYPVVAFNFQSNGYFVNGTAQVNYISTNFVVGTSTLTPPGGRLGQTLLLGSSKIGVEYGF